MTAAKRFPWRKVLMLSVEQRSSSARGGVWIWISSGHDSRPRADPTCPVPPVMRMSGIKKPSRSRGPADRYHNGAPIYLRSEEHTSELQSLMRLSYAVFCLTQKNPTIAPRSAHLEHDI